MSPVQIEAILEASEPMPLYHLCIVTVALFGNTWARPPLDTLCNDQGTFVDFPEPQFPYTHNTEQFPKAPSKSLPESSLHVLCVAGFD